METKITRGRWKRYRDVQMSGKMNMFGYDMTIQKHYDALFKWFEEDLNTEDFVVEVKE